MVYVNVFIVQSRMNFILSFSEKKYSHQWKIYKQNLIIGLNGITEKELIQENIAMEKHHGILFYNQKIYLCKNNWMSFAAGGLKIIRLTMPSLSHKNEGLATEGDSLGGLNSVNMNLTKL